MAQPPILGKNTTITFLLAGEGAKANNLVVRPQSGSIKPNGVTVEDDILGAIRTEVSYELKYYDVNFVSTIKDLKLLRALLKYQAQLDLQVAMADSTLGVVIRPNNGTREAFQLRGFTLLGWELNLAGRTEKQTITIPGACSYFEPLAVGP
jgi:hypothetical protein